MNGAGPSAQRLMVNLGYDTALAGWTNGPVSQHDLTNYGLGFTARGNVAGAWSYGGRSTLMQYNVLGEVVKTWLGGTTVDTTYNATNNWTAPVAITPNSNSAMQTTLGWNGWFAPTSRTGANGASETVQYNAVGRPEGTNNDDGTWTGYAYDDANRQATTTVNGVATRTTFDGLGRPVKTETFNGGAGTSIVAITETEYQPCGCTPFGKVKRVSLPYAPGGTPQWTTMVYDAIGRTVQVQQPASSGTSTTAYAGNTVTVTDPAGRWKKYTSDALGNLTQVTEPNPQGGANFETYYTYNVAGKLTQVSMPRPNIGWVAPGTTTQTRTFVYDNDGKLTSTTNPENGTTTYTYAGDLLDYKVDAKGQKVKFTYDSYERVKKIEPFATTSATTPIECEVVENFYDQWASSVGRLSYQKWGNKDLTKCAKGESTYQYQYTSMGRVTSKKFVSLQNRLNPGTNQMADFTADLETLYEYEIGRLKKVTYPSTFTHDGNTFAALPGHIYNYAYDAMGRSSSATYQINGAAPAQNLVWGATYNAFSQMTAMQWEGGNAMSWTYDTLGRLTGMPALGITYSFSPTADDGKITSMTSGGVTVNYSYDSLGRLAAAATSGPQWGLSWLYDGFGNRLQQNVTKAAAGYNPPSSNLFVDPATNRVASSPWAYDANGNATNIPGVGSITYDWANRVSAVGSETYGYDPGNKRLWKNDKFTLWGAGSERIGTYELMFNQENVGGSYIWRLRFKMLATDRYFAGRKLQYEDRLGSKDPWTGYYPYGEQISSTANPADKFATYHRDATGLDYADQRYYHSASGRFVSSDPYQASGGPTDPSSWNRFSYTRNDPTNRNDRSGLADEGVPPPELFCYPWCNIFDKLKRDIDEQRSAHAEDWRRSSNDDRDQMLWAFGQTSIQVRATLAAALNNLSRNCKDKLGKTKLKDGRSVMDSMVGVARTVNGAVWNNREGGLSVVDAGYFPGSAGMTVAQYAADVQRRAGRPVPAFTPAGTNVIFLDYYSLNGRDAQSLVLHEGLHVLFSQVGLGRHVDIFQGLGLDGSELEGLEGSDKDGRAADLFEAWLADGCK